MCLYEICNKDNNVIWSRAYTQSYIFSAVYNYGILDKNQKSPPMSVTISNFEPWSAQNFLWDRFGYLFRQRSEEIWIKSMHYGKQPWAMQASEWTNVYTSKSNVILCTQYGEQPPDWITQRCGWLMDSAMLWLRLKSFHPFHFRFSVFSTLVWFNLTQNKGGLMLIILSNFPYSNLDSLYYTTFIVM